MIVDVPLNPHQEEFVRQKVESRRFLSIEHLFLAAINLLEDRERVLDSRLEKMHEEIRKSRSSRTGSARETEPVVSAEHSSPVDA
jgi:Arc/MetJ-type ribon-helix-helix transcriptional regulator